MSRVVEPGPRPVAPLEYDQPAAMTAGDVGAAHAVELAEEKLGDRRARGLREVPGGVAPYQTLHWP